MPVSKLELDKVTGADRKVLPETATGDEIVLLAIDWRVESRAAGDEVADFSAKGEKAEQGHRPDYVVICLCPLPSNLPLPSSFPFTSSLPLPFALCPLPL